MDLPAEMTTGSEEATRRAGRELAEDLRPGDVVLVSGDLGAGKTVFVRGVVEGLGGDPGEVASPTFALVHEYSAPAGRILHLDLYRIRDEEEELRQIGIPEIAAGRVCLVEWPRPRSRELLRPTHEVRIDVLSAASRRLRIERCA